MNFLLKLLNKYKRDDKSNIVNLYKKDNMNEESIYDFWNNQDYFSLEEIVPQAIYTYRGDKCLELFTREALETLIELRELFDAPMTVNTWKWNGNFGYRGFRPVTYYAKLSLSQHIRGNAFDFDVKGLTADEARDKIRQWKKEGKLKHITGMEIDINWVHVDCRLVNPNRLNEFGLFEFKP